jgi:hypothetical protein
LKRLLPWLPPVTALVCLTALRAAGADFRVDQRDLPSSPQIVAYGDMRFTDPNETDASNPKVRRWLVDRIAAEKPDAVLLSGDVPWHGNQANDYEVYRTETKIWREGHLRIYPALGNHEFQGVEQVCLDNWWHAFPEFHGRRFYSVQFGDSIYMLNLDSNSPLTPGSEQLNWVSRQLIDLPKTARFVLLNLHHPPVVDFQAGGDDSHNGRPNELALAKLLAIASKKSPVRFIVAAGHIHNYERFDQDGIVYLVSGGGGAKPRPVEREAKDLYQGREFPNYHYVKLVVEGGKVRGTMVRVADPEATAPRWEEKDHFEVLASQSLR